MLHLKTNIYSISINLLHHILENIFLFPVDRVTFRIIRIYCCLGNKISKEQVKSYKLKLPTISDVNNCACFYCAVVINKPISCLLLFLLKLFSIKKNNSLYIFKVTFNYFLFKTNLYN